jgi:hypothetical protein
MSKKLFGGSERKRSWGRGIRIDSWERLELVVDLIKSSLPIDINMDLYHAEASRRTVSPLPYDPLSESPITVPTPLPFLAEVLVSLCIDETLAWLLPVQFCIDQLLTAEEVVTKLADALAFLKAWSQVHTQEGREHLRSQRALAKRPAKSPSKYLVQ